MLTTETSYKKNLNRDIIKLALPAVLNNITVPLLGLCDTAISGHLGNASFIGAASVGAMMLNVAFWLCGFLRMGTTGITANAVGAGSAALIKESLSKSLQIALLISLLLLIFQVPIKSLLLNLIQPDNDVESLASQYFDICVWAAPAQLIIMAVSGWFVGLQTTVVPMIIAISVNVINILMSVLLVFGCKIGFAGIAYGTLVANWSGFLIAAIFIFFRWRKLPPSSASSQLENDSKIGWHRFFGVNVNLFFRSACIMSVSLAVTSIGARMGNVVLAANAVMMQFFLFFSYFMDGFAFAGEALVGKAKGARSFTDINRSVKALLKWGASMALLFFAVYWFATPTIVALLTDDASVRDFAGTMHWWLVALPPITVLAFVFDGVFVGLTDTFSLLIATLIATAFFFFIVASERFAPSSDHLLWLAFEIYLLMRGGILGVKWWRMKKYGSAKLFK